MKFTEQEQKDYKAASDKAREVQCRLAATRFEAHFCIIYRGTAKDADSRLRLFTDLNKWFAANNGNTGDVLNAITKFILNTITAGEKKK